MAVVLSFLVPHCRCVGVFCTISVARFNAFSIQDLPPRLQLHWTISHILLLLPLLHLLPIPFLQRTIFPPTLLGLTRLLFPVPLLPLHDATLGALLQHLDLLGEYAPRDRVVLAARARRLRLHYDPRRQVRQLRGAVGLIDFLAAGPGAFQVHVCDV